MLECNSRRGRGFHTAGISAKCTKSTFYCTGKQMLLCVCVCVTKIGQRVCWNRYANTQLCIIPVICCFNVPLSWKIRNNHTNVSSVFECTWVSLFIIHNIHFLDVVVEECYWISILSTAMRHFSPHSGDKLTKICCSHWTIFRQLATHRRLFRIQSFLLSIKTGCHFIIQCLWGCNYLTFKYQYLFTK